MTDFPSPLCDDDLKVIVVNESVYKSWMVDIVTFGCLFGGFWLNHQFMGSGWILQIILAIMFVAVIFARNAKISRKMTPKEALTYLQQRYGAAS